MFDICDLYRQEFVWYSLYRAKKITEEQYLSYIKPLDKAISELEMASIQSHHVSKKAFLQHFQIPEH